MFSHILSSLNESAKYIKEILDIKSSKQDLLSDNQDDSLVSFNIDDLEDDISETVSLQKTPSNNYIDMSIMLTDSTVNYDILPMDIGSEIAPDYEMLGLQQNFLPLF